MMCFDHLSEAHTHMSSFAANMPSLAKITNPKTFDMVMKAAARLIDRYCVPEFPHSSATFNIISGFCILASPKLLQEAFGDSACPTQCSQPCPMLANRHLTGLTWFPIVLYYVE